MSDNDESEHEKYHQSLSSDSASLSETETNHTGGVSNDSSISIARAETKAVNRSKIIVLAVIAIAATACGAATYLFTKSEEEDDFHSQFKDFAVEIVDISHLEAQNIFGTIESFATTLTSFSIDTEIPWPLVDIPHFELRGRMNNALSKALMISYSPLVTAENRADWEDHAFAKQGWIQEGIDLSPDLHEGYLSDDFKLANISKDIFRFSDGATGLPVIQDRPGTDFGPGQYAPIWEQAPAPHDPSIINFDLLSHPVFNRVYHGMWETRLPVISEVTDLDFFYGGAIRDDVDHPHSFLMHPVYPYFSPNFSYAVDDLVGFVVAILPWDSYFTNVLPEGVNGMVVVLHDTCGDHYTYQLDGPEAIFIGQGDLHDTSYDYMEIDTEFNPFIQYNFSDTREHCEYDIRIYPSKMMEDSYTSNKPALYTTVVVLVFIFTAMVFVLYDCLVQRRQDKVMATAKRTNAIVSSLFPSNVRDRILKDAEEQAEQDMQNNKKGFFGAAPKNRLKSFLDEDDVAGAHAFDTKPIADLFPHTTVMFGDIVGFTAWSSVREPSQVFTLLETVYHAFDEIAKRRRVFKVETIGDCYVAVTGLPDPRKDHAIIMARFARDALNKMNDLAKRLEVTLGPDTGDLSMRFGLHSGPVTAGVLRGDKSRFQLFGDTVNTAARIESTGQRNKIHLSKETADLLINAGKSHWVSARQELVQAKGKGDMQTYWLSMKVQSGASSKSGTTESSADDDGAKPQVDVDESKWVEAGLKEKIDVKSANAISDDKAQRLVDWNTDILARLLKQVVARRNVSHTAPAASTTIVRHSGTPTAYPTHASKLYLDDNGRTALDEVKEIIHLPEFDARSASHQDSPESIVLGEEAMAQLRDYVSIIATMYRDNPFHNFEHASHVTMSVVKLLSRIVAPDQVAAVEDSVGMYDLASTLHDHTYGITSDPLTQFACVFAALIHDVDHTGLPNTQLVKEKTALASAYNGRSVAEQNSVDVAWALLMDDSFSTIRRIIYSNNDELKHFRQLVVNSVMATDIMDKDLKELRNSRWDRAFQESTAAVPESMRDTVNRKATIVIEHLIQASDVSHTMQHWHIYRKWNERLFQEMYLAFKSGHADKDPSEFWYKGEMGFFDFYIIPLAKKLKDCGVFGVSSDEYLNYAQKNRQEWERRGQDVVASMIEKFSVLYADYDNGHDQDHDGVRLEAEAAVESVLE